MVELKPGIVCTDKILLVDGDDIQRTLQFETSKYYFFFLGICSLIGMLIITVSVGNLPGHVNYGYSYFLGWTGTGLSFFTAALIYIASKDNLYTEGVYA